MGDHTLMHFSFWYLPLRCYYLYMYCFLLWLITYLFTAAAAAAATATTIHTAVIPQSILKKTIWPWSGHQAVQCHPDRRC